MSWAWILWLFDKKSKNASSRTLKILKKPRKNQGFSTILLNNDFSVIFVFFLSLKHDFHSKKSLDHTSLTKTSLQGGRMGDRGAPRRPLEAALGSLLATLGGTGNILRFLWVFSSTPGESIPTIWGPQGVIFNDFSRFYEAKVHFAKKYIAFPCIRAILSVCYAGKSWCSQTETTLLPA